VTTCRSCRSRPHRTDRQNPSAELIGPPVDPVDPVDPVGPVNPVGQGEPGRPSAALLLRVWPEGDELRGRLLGFTDMSSAARVLAVAQGVDAICDAVRRWLLEV
jgi:hypothetical protein